MLCGPMKQLSPIDTGAYSYGSLPPLTAHLTVLCVYMCTPALIEQLDPIDKTPMPSNIVYGPIQVLLPTRTSPKTVQLSYTLVPSPKPRYFAFSQRSVNNSFIGNTRLYCFFIMFRFTANSRFSIVLIYLFIVKINTAPPLKTQERPK